MSFKPIREVPHTANFKEKRKKNSKKLGRLKLNVYLCKTNLKNNLLIKKQKLWERF